MSNSIHVSESGNLWILILHPKRQWQRERDRVKAHVGMDREALEAFDAAHEVGPRPVEEPSPFEVPLELIMATGEKMWGEPQ